MSPKPVRGLPAALADALSDGGWHAKARPSQLPPAGDWNGWLFLGGRGAGKTRAGAEWVLDLAQRGKVGQIALVAPTSADARDVMVEGHSGILACAPQWFRPDFEPSKRRVTFPNGAMATLFSSEEPERLRGPQFGAAWSDETAAWANADYTWDMLQFGLRLGLHPRWLVTTTPKPTKLLKALLARVGEDVVLTRDSTFANQENLAPTFIKAIRERYENTRLGRQELEAELLSDTPGALWTLDMIEGARVKSAPDLKRIVVAIDPAVSTTEKSDETGIIVAGVDAGGDIFVLDDLSGRYAPAEWARVAIGAFDSRNADRIVGEANQGGAMVENTLRTLRASIPYKAVHASRGKVTRAEPVAAFYEQRRVHHVGILRELEDQQCAFTSDFDRRRTGYSPDRVDALVWAVTELLPLKDTRLSAMSFWDAFGKRRKMNIAETMPPIELARRGIFNPINRDEWIRRGALKPDGSPTLDWKGEKL